MALKPAGFRLQFFGLIGMMLIGWTCPSTAASSTASSAVKKLPASKLVTKAPTEESKSEKSLQGLLALNYSRSLINHDDGGDQSSRGALVALSRKIFSGWSVAGRLAAQEDLQDSENINNGLSDLQMSLGQSPRPLSKWIDGAWTLMAVLPTSQVSQKETNLRGAFGTAYKFAAGPEILIPGLQTTLTLGLSKNYHQYETGASGQALNSYTLKEALATEYSDKKFSLAIEFVHRHLFNYENNVSENFEHTEEVGYRLLPAWRVAMGHTNAGSWLKANMQDSNLDLINEDSSVVYISTELMF